MLKKVYVCRSIFTALVFLLFSLNSYGTPSLVDTINFILEKTNLNLGDGHGSQRLVFANKFAKKGFHKKLKSRCYLRVSTSSYLNTRTEIRQDNFGRLKDLDPTRISVYDGSVALDTKNDAEKVYSIDYGWGSTKNGEFVSNKIKINRQQWGSAFLIKVLTQNPQNPEKVAKAFSHAIRLCGGTGELF